MIQAWQLHHKLNVIAWSVNQWINVNTLTKLPADPDNVKMNGKKYIFIKRDDKKKGMSCIRVHKCLWFAITSSLHNYQHASSLLHSQSRAGLRCPSNPSRWLCDCAQLTLQPNAAILWSICSINYPAAIQGQYSQQMLHQHDPAVEHAGNTLLKSLFLYHVHCFKFSLVHICLKLWWLN